MPQYLQMALKEDGNFAVFMGCSNGVPTNQRSFLIRLESGGVVGLPLGVGVGSGNA